MDETTTPTSRINPVEFQTTYGVRVTNLNKWLDNKKFTKFLNSLDLKCRKSKKVSGQEFGFITFDTAEDRDKCKEILHGKEVDGRKLSVADKKRGNESDTSENLNKRHKANKHNENNQLAPKTIQDVVTPLWNVPYEQQIEKKKNLTLDVFRTIVNRIRDASSYNVPSWLRQKKVEFCPFEGVIGSPVLEGYRNKCAFTIGFDGNDKPMIGFQLGKTEKGTFTVEDPTSCVNLPEVAKEVRSSFQNYVEKSQWKPFNKKERHGFWRELTLRCFTTGEVMAMLQINPTGLTDEEVKKEKQELIDYVKSNSLPIQSLVVQFNNTVSDVSDAPYQLLYGSPYVHEKLLGLTFQISPSAFFQVNTPGTEILYSKVREWCQIDENTTVLDICCGTGTIGLTIAKAVKQVIGVEMVPEAVENAKANAKANEVANAKFFVGKAEDVLGYQLANLKHEKCVAVVDPPRAGLHPKVIQAIRNCPAIHRLIFVSCDKSGLIDNSVGLCRSASKTMKGAPFKPIKSVGVDLFPGTELVERVVLFERIEETSEANSDSKVQTESDKEAKESKEEITQETKQEDQQQ